VLVAREIAVTRYVALLRAVNVGGTGKLAMSELRALCEQLGFTDVATYIQSGNVVFSSGLSEQAVKGALAGALEQHMGQPVGVLVRTPDELAAVLDGNPFPHADPARVIVLFLDAAPDALGMTLVAEAPTPGGEQLKLVGRELFVHYPEGQGPSKLKVPFAREGTGRNLNTVRKLLDLARG
jgi:uncharacterized protein (DUF1697 family)